MKRKGEEMITDEKTRYGDVLRRMDVERLSQRIPEFSIHRRNTIMRNRKVYKKIQFEDGIIIGILVVIALVFIFGLFGVICSERTKVEEYNNGICKQCGGKYEYLQAIGHEDYTTYLYRCRQCGKMLELSEAR
jgi:hypothetical protein